MIDSNDRRRTNSEAFMTVAVRIPTILQPLTGGQRTVEAQGATLRELIRNLEVRHPGIAERLVDEGELRRFVNVYVNEEDVRYLGGLAAPLADGDEVTVLPAVAGGAA
jgi:molybdopterin synthase sulfur carrier subunit